MFCMLTEIFKSKSRKMKEWTIKLNMNYVPDICVTITIN